MLLKHSVLIILVLPYVFAKNSTLTKLDATNELKVNAKHNTAKLFNEGGAALSEDPSLSKGNDLLSLSKEIGKLKKISSVVRKNGVKFPEDELVVNKTNSNITSSITKSSNVSESKEIHEKISVTNKNESNKTSVDTIEVNKPLIHKPLILSYETLSQIGANQNGQTFPNILSSSKTIPDQVQSPNESNSKFYTMNAVKHPGMIMPIVITILIVPMFVVLAYMAVKRGKEAWKNRHYKRMDFLLDGMYND